MKRIARTVQLVSRPVGMPTTSNFQISEVELDGPEQGEVLLRTLWLSLDPYMRGMMSEKSTSLPSILLGGSMPSECLARVIDSNDPSLKPGDVVFVDDYWRDYAVRKASDCRRIEVGAAPIQAALSVLGLTGLTAYAGLKHIGKPQTGETLVVGAATGAVGSIVGQIAKIAGARVVGVAGGSDKCRFAMDELGFDYCLDRYQPELTERLAKECPNGIDVYFDLTGGDILNAALPLLNRFARVPVCGGIAHYNDTQPPAGPDRLPDLMATILNQSLTVRGFLVFDFLADYEEFSSTMQNWLAGGRIRYREDVSDGLEAMPSAFIRMLEGRNFGKALIRIL